MTPERANLALALRAVRRLRDYYYRCAEVGDKLELPQYAASCRVRAWQWHEQALALRSAYRGWGR